MIGVRVIEEAAEPGGLLYVTRRMARRHGRDGFILGAAVGFGRRGDADRARRPGPEGGTCPDG